MRNIYFTPGPTQLHPAVQKAFDSALKDDICSISHRSEGFRAIYCKAVAALRALMNIPETSHVLFLASATEAMERVLQSCVAEQSFHLVNGAFSKRFYEIARMLGKDALKLEIEAGSGVLLCDMEMPESAELLCITQNETSTGVYIPPEDIRALKQCHRDQFIAVDIVSSAPYAELDLSLLDIAFFSVQKCFGMPSGLGVLIVNEQSVEKARILSAEKRLPDSFHALPRLVDYGMSAQTYETPNVLSIYLLGEIAAWMLEYGIGKIRKEIDEKYSYLVSALKQLPAAKIFVEEERFRSPTVINVSFDSDVSALRKALGSEGLHVGVGYGEFKDTQMRIANFPAHTMEDMQRLVESLKRLGV